MIEAGRSTPSTRRKFARSELGPRVVSGFILIAAALAVAWLGGHWFALFWLAAAAIVFWEWLLLIGARRQRFVCLAVGAAALAIAAPLSVRGAADYGLAAILLAALALALLAERGRRLWSVAGLLYASAVLLPIAMLRGSPVFGLTAVLWVFAVVWGTDILAYFGGRVCGGPKLWPRLSPAKTWSGFAIGVSGGALAGLAVVPASINNWSLLLLGLATGATAQAGDLFESALKRHFGVKDTSSIIPGHGGVMDRLDGFIAASLFAVLVGGLRAGFAAPAQGLFR
jgi:phosphatidate cytidylyltransferase